MRVFKPRRRWFNPQGCAAEKTSIFHGPIGHGVRRAVLHALAQFVPVPRGQVRPIVLEAKVPLCEVEGSNPCEQEGKYRHKHSFSN